MVGLLIVSATLGTFQRSAAKNGTTDRATSWVRTALSPIASPSRWLATSSSDFFSGILRARALSAENRMLRDQAHIVEQYADVLALKEHDLDDLRKLVGLPPSQRARIPADVRGYNISENRIFLNVGTKDGVTAGLAVMTGRGLVGVVETTEPHRCQVLLITSRQQVGAIDISRNPPAIGIMRGFDSTTVEMTFQDPKAPVQVGDTIATSGLGEHIPRSIIVGKVIRVDAREEYGTTKAIIDPMINIGSLREVFVVR